MSNPLPDQQEAFRRLCDVRQRECPHGYRKPEGAILNARCIHCVIEQGADGLQRLTDLQTALDASESSRREVGGEGSYYELAVRLSNVQAENIRLRSELQEMRTLHQIDQRLLEAKSASVETPRVPGWPSAELFFYLLVTTMAAIAIVWTWRQM